MKILIIEDNKNISNNTAEYLRMKFFQVEQAFDGESGFEEALKCSYDCIVLDRMLPKLDGLSIARMLRSRKINTPILFLTAKDGIFEKLEGLEIGGDDYMVKPFDLEELTLRIKNILRRTSTENELERILAIDDITFDLQKHTIIKGKNPVQLSPKEYAIVEYLILNRGKVVSKSELYDNIWKYYGDDFFSFSNTVNVHLTHIRKKLGNSLIRTVKEVGHIID